MHLDEAVLVWGGPVDDDEDEVVVLVELGPVVELLGVLDRERIKLEHLAQDRVGGLVEIEPEEAAVCKHSRSAAPESKRISSLPRSSTT